MAWVVPNGCYYAARKQGVWNYYNENTTVNTEHDPTTDTITFVLVDFLNGYIYSSAVNFTIELADDNTFVLSTPQGKLGMIAPPQFYASIDCINYTNRFTLIGEFSFGDGSGIMDASDFLPSGTSYDMSNAFYKRTDIVSASIPEGVRSLIGTFGGCTSLTSVSDITITGISLQGTFSGCTSLTIAPTIPSGVTNIKSCFKGCTSLTTAPTIPAGVTIAESCFEDCTSLTGPITIDASPTNITNMFAGTVQDIILFGTGGLNETLVSEYANLYFWSLSAIITAQREEQTPTTVNVSVDVSRFNTGTLSSLNLYRDNSSTPLSVTWNDPTLTIDSIPETFATTLTNIGESDTFTLSVVATDIYGSSTAVSVKIPISFYTMDVQAGGKEIAFGGLADDDVTLHPNGLFKCAMDAYFEGDVVISGGDIGGTSIPTADTNAQFDSDAHMNSTDMTSQEVEDFIDGLNITGGITDDDGTWKSVNNYLKYSKRFGCVYIQGVSSGNVTLTAASWNNIGTLPEGYRPTSEIIFTAFDRNHIQPLMCSVTTAGVVRLYCDSGQACSYWLYGGSFPVAS